MGNLAGLATLGGTSHAEKETFSPASTFMELVEYDPQSRTMDVTFHSGAKTRYINVFPSIFLNFKQSPTHSAFYARAIKGRLMSVSLVSKSIGKQHSTPLKKLQKGHHLDHGLKQQLARRDRTAGAVKRAFNAVAVGS